MVVVLPFIFIIFGFVFAFIGGSISSDMNHVPLYRMIDEMIFYIQSKLNGAGQASNVLSFDLIHDFLIPGSLYFLAIACMIGACKMIYQQIETEKLEESFLRIAIMTVIALMTIMLCIKGGATLLIITIGIVFFVNVYQWVKYLCFKGILQ